SARARVARLGAGPEALVAVLVEVERGQVVVALARLRDARVVGAWILVIAVDRRVRLALADHDRLAGVARRRPAVVDDPAPDRVAEIVEPGAVGVDHALGHGGRLRRDVE